MPTDAEWIAIGQMCNAAVSLIGAIGALFAWMQGRKNAAANRTAAIKAEQDNAASRAAIQEVHASVNGQLEASRRVASALLSTSITAAHARGVADEKANPSS
jgi:alpha-D-ribose 1-methylphosphonate 5-triphosphate synthase subunit PhnG